MNLCQYKDLFGKPSEGVHRYRIFNIAVVDVVVTVVFAWIIWWILNRFVLPRLAINTKIPFLPFLLAVFVLGVFVHRAFCVRTGMDKMLFPKG